MGSCTKRGDIATIGLESGRQVGHRRIQFVQLHHIWDVPTLEFNSVCRGRHSRFCQHLCTAPTMILPPCNIAEGDSTKRGENLHQSLRFDSRPQGELPVQVVECRHGTGRRIVRIHIKDHPFRTIFEGVQISQLIDLSFSDSYSQHHGDEAKHKLQNDINVLHILFVVRFLNL